MTILQVSAYAGPTGGNHISSLLYLEGRMKENGYETVYAFLETVRDYEWCREIQKKAKVYFLPVNKARVRIKTYQILRRIFKSHNIQIVHSHFELYDIPVAVTAPKGTKILWHLHDAIEEIYLRSNITRKMLMRLQYRVFANRAKVITVSEKHGYFICKLGFDRNKLLYVPNGIDINRIRLINSESMSRDFLIFTWDFYRKGGDLAVQAGKKLIDEGYEIAIKFVPGNSVNESFVIPTPPVKDVNDLFSDVGCFLHLSRAEGLSYALLEAVYSGLPVICSDIPENMPVKNCPTVFIVPNENVESIAAAMKRIYTGNIRFTQSEIAASRSIIYEHFSLERWADRIMDIYFENRQ